ncbi:MAG: hypothetical protein HOI65_14510 [Opitutae bacterium]|nr:hypothetical protein [Opitutae bacterium]
MDLSRPTHFSRSAEKSGSPDAAGGGHRGEGSACKGPLRLKLPREDRLGAYGVSFCAISPAMPSWRVLVSSGAFGAFGGPSFLWEQRHTAVDELHRFRNCIQKGLAPQGIFSKPRQGIQGLVKGGSGSPDREAVWGFLAGARFPSP